MEVIMFRKVLVVAGAAALVAASLTAVPASAATKVSNGVACKKAGATTKVSGSSYKCAKNPLVKNSKLTWLSLDCLKTAGTYTTNFANLPKIKANTESAIAKIDADIVTKQVEAEKAKVLIPEFRGKIADINPELTRLLADTANLTKNQSKITRYKNAIRTYESAIKTFEDIENQILRSQKLKGQVQSQFDSTKMDVDTTLSMAKIICTKGF